MTQGANTTPVNTDQGVPVRNQPKVEPGYFVFDNQGTELGEVKSVGAGYIHLQKGLFFTKDLYVPLAAVTYISDSEGKVEIGVTKDQVESADWFQAIEADFAPGGKYDTGLASTERVTTNVDARVDAASPNMPGGPTYNTTPGIPGQGTASNGPSTAEQFQAAKHFDTHDEIYADPYDQAGTKPEATGFEQ